MDINKKIEKFLSNKEETYNQENVNKALNFAYQFAKKMLDWICKYKRYLLSDNRMVSKACLFDIYQKNTLSLC